MNLFSAACIVVAATAFGLAIYAWKLDSKALLNRFLVATSLVAAFRVLGSGLVNLAGTPASFWLFLHLTLSASLFIVPLMFAVNLMFAGVSRPWRALLVGPVLVLTLIELLPVWTGQWIVKGYRITPWGNELLPTNSTVWMVLFDATVEYCWVVALAAFVLGFLRTKSGRQKAILVQLFLFLLIIDLGSILFAPVLWKSWGSSDPSVLLAGLHVLNYLVLVARYRALTKETTNFSGEMFQSLHEAVFLVDGEGRVVQTSDKMARLLGKPGVELKGRKVNSLLPGWPQLVSDLEVLQREHHREASREGTLRNARFVLTMRPHKDQFGNLRGVLMTVKSAEDLTLGVHQFGISDREQEVANLLLEGLGTREIADKLFISAATVRNHLAKLFQKTGTKNRVELVRRLRS